MLAMPAMCPRSPGNEHPGDDVPVSWSEKRNPPVRDGLRGHRRPAAAAAVGGSRRAVASGPRRCRSPRPRGRRRRRAPRASRSRGLCAGCRRSATAIDPRSRSSEPSQQPRRNAPQRGCAVAVRGVVGAHHGDRDAQAGVREQRGLVVDLARDALAPAALEGDLPAGRQRRRRCPSAGPRRCRAAAPSRTRGGAAARAGRRAGRSAPGRRP